MEEELLPLSLMLEEGLTFGVARNEIDCFESDIINLHCSFADS